MADQSINVTNPVKVVSDSSSRVAFEFMVHIGHKVFETDKESQKTKDYWLKLYRQCYKATAGHSSESILKDE